MRPFRNKLSSLLAATLPLLVAAPLAHATQCRGSKIVQNCVAYHADGTWWVSDLSKPVAYTNCQLVQVPCDYPTDIFDLLTKILPPDR